MNDGYNQRSRQDGQQQRPPHMQGQRPPQNMNRKANPSGNRNVATRNPRPQQQRPAPRENKPHGIQGYAKYLSQTVTAKHPSRNMILFGVLILVIILVIVIVAVQSCANRNRTKNENQSETSALITTSVTDTEVKTPGTGVFAKRTDNTETLNINSEYGILIDLQSNEIIADKNSDARMYPASMTKVMTLVVAYEHINDLEDTFKYTSDLLAPLFEAQASQAGFQTDDEVKLIDMLYGAILPSGADATIGLATYVAGSESAFAELMNEKAKELGLKDTHFVNASGLHDDNHYSTCHDMAVIIRYALTNPTMRKILGTYQYTTSPIASHPEGITLTSNLKSRMNGDEAEGVFVQGGKTGYTVEARNCLVTFAACCTEAEAEWVDPQYVLVTASVLGEYGPIWDAIKVYAKYCGTGNTSVIITN